MSEALRVRETGPRPPQVVYSKLKTANGTKKKSVSTFSGAACTYPAQVHSCFLEAS